jgi:hypothetical protein
LSVVEVGFTASPYWHIQIDPTTMILLDPYQANAVYNVHMSKIAPAIIHTPRSAVQPRPGPAYGDALLIGPSVTAVVSPNSAK